MSWRPLAPAPAAGTLPSRVAPPVPVRRPRAALLVAHAGPPPATGEGGRPDADALRPWLEALASRLLTALPVGWRVLVATLGGRPPIAEALDEIESAGIEELVVVPLYPCFSPDVTGAITEHLYRVLAESRTPLRLATRSCWYDDIGYVSAQAAVVGACASANGLGPANSHLLFWAPEAPPAPGPGGDPYERQMQRSAQLIAERLGWPAAHRSLVFERSSEAGASLGPRARGRLAELLEAAEPSVLLCPLGAPCGSAVALPAPAPPADAARPLGHPSPDPNGGRVHCCPALPTQAGFLPVLRDLVLRGVRPVMSCRPASAAPQPAQTDGDPQALVMIGASLGSGAPREDGPAPLRHSTPAAFAAVKQSRKALRECLERISGEPAVSEAFIWDTCQRVELYGWLADPDDAEARERTMDGLRRLLFEDAPEGLAINARSGLEAWRHLMRTACGLESRVPGDTDVVAQLQTALHLAQSARAAGPRAARLVADAARLAERVRTETAWGAYSSGYCGAALSRVQELRSPHAETGYHVVVGGSTTSRSILTALAQWFGVPQRQLTLIYRDHHGQLKLLRAAVGQGRRLRVHSYSEPGVLRAIADADFVYFGLDHSGAVLDPGLLGGLRDFRGRPLTVLDFNSFGSLGSAAAPEGVTVWSAEALDRAVAAHAAALRRGAGFRSAVVAAEEWIERHAPTDQVPACLNA